LLVSWEHVPPQNSPEAARSTDGNDSSSLLKNLRFESVGARAKWLEKEALEQAGVSALPWHLTVRSPVGPNSESHERQVQSGTRRDGFKEKVLQNRNQVRACPIRESVVRSTCAMELLESTHLLIAVRNGEVANTERQTEWTGRKEPAPAACFAVGEKRVILYGVTTYD